MKSEILLYRRHRMYQGIHTHVWSYIHMKCLIFAHLLSILMWEFLWAEGSHECLIAEELCQHGEERTTKKLGVEGEFKCRGFIQKRWPSSLTRAGHNWVKIQSQFPPYHPSTASHDVWEAYRTTNFISKNLQPQRGFIC